MSEVEQEIEVTSNDAQSARKEIEDFIQHVNQQNFSQAEKSFKDMVGGRMGDVLDQQKAKIAGQIFNEIEPDVEDEEVEDEEAETPDDEEEVES